MPLAQAIEGPRERGVVARAIVGGGRAGREPRAGRAAVRGKRTWEEIQNVRETSWSLHARAISISRAIYFLEERRARSCTYRRACTKSPAIGATFQSRAGLGISVTGSHRRLIGQGAVGF